jgi:hypothetical protein
MAKSTNIEPRFSYLDVWEILRDEGVKQSDADTFMVKHRERLYDAVSNAFYEEVRSINLEEIDNK